MSSLPVSETPQNPDALVDFARSELELFELGTGRDALVEAKAIIELRSDVLFNRHHGLALYCLAAGFRGCIEERDTLISTLMAELQQLKASLTVKPSQWMH
jgi:hypothetical protein